MPKTTVNTPTGQITVNHPEGASQDDILEFAVRQHEAQLRAKADRRAETIASNPAEFDANSPEFRERYGAALPGFTGGVENFFAGAGKFLADRRRGLGQLIGSTSQDEIDEARELDRDLMNTKAGLAGNIIGGGAFTAPLALTPGINTGLGASLAGGAIGFTEPVASGESRGVNTLLGGAGGFAGQRISRALGGGSSRGVVSNLNRAEREALRRGRELGFKATPGTASGSTRLRQIEAALESKPFTSGPLNRIKDSNQLRANQIVADAIGEVDDVVDSTTLGRAFNRMSEGFESFAESIPNRPIPQDRGQAFLRSLADEYADVFDVPVMQQPLIKRLTKLIASGEATGAQLRSLTSKLGNRANTMMTSAAGDRDMGRALLSAKEFVDDLIEEGLPLDDLLSYRALRDQYRNYSLITSRQNVINKSSGNVNLNALASALESKAKRGFVRGQDRSALFDAARFGQAFRPIVGNSGTATRSMGPADVALGLPANIASRAFFSPASTAIASQGNQTLKNIGSLLGPAADPKLLALLGASAATGAN